MTRDYHDVIAGFATFVACCFYAAESGFAEKTQPNIVLILADDWATAILAATAAIPGERKRHLPHGENWS